MRLTRVLATTTVVAIGVTALAVGATSAREVSAASRPAPTGSNEVPEAAAQARGSYPTTASDLAIGYRHGLALVDGRVVVFGPDRRVNDANQPPDEVNAGRVVTDVAASNRHSVAVVDGRVVVWGDRPYVDDDAPEGPSDGYGDGRNDVTSAKWKVPRAAQRDVTAVATGNAHVVALRDGWVVAWGASTQGRLDVPAEIAWSERRRAPGPVAAIDAEYRYTLAVRKNGTVVGWGYPDLTGLFPVPPEERSSGAAVSAGFVHPLTLRTDGTVHTWTPQPTGAGTALPAGLNDGGRVTAISAGNERSMAIKDGRVIWWDRLGSLLPVPRQLENARTTMISAGHFCGSRAELDERGCSSINAAVNDGRLVVWDDKGEVLNNVADVPLAGRTIDAGPTTTATVTTGELTIRGAAGSPIAADLPDGAVTKVSVDAHGLAIVRGRVRAWGPSIAATDVPPGIEDAIDVAAGPGFSLAVDRGRVVAWGRGRVADPPADLNRGVTAVAASSTHGLAIRFGRVFQWGRGRVPRKLPADGVTAVAAGKKHSVALVGGRVYVWDNDSTRLRRDVPNDLMSGVSAIAAGDFFSVALKGGRVYIWGRTTEALRPIPRAASSGVTAIAAGARHVAAVSSGQLVAWGDDREGQVTNTAPVGRPTVEATVSGRAVAWAWDTGMRNPTGRPPRTWTTSLVVERLSSGGVWTAERRCPTPAPGQQTGTCDIGSVPYESRWRLVITVRPEAAPNTYLPAELSRSSEVNVLQQITSVSAPTRLSLRAGDRTLTATARAADVARCPAAYYQFKLGNGRWRRDDDGSREFTGLENGREYTVAVRRSIVGLDDCTRRLSPGAAAVSAEIEQSETPVGQLVAPRVTGVRIGWTVVWSIDVTQPDNGLAWEATTSCRREVGGELTTWTARRNEDATLTCFARTRPGVGPARAPVVRISAPGVPGLLSVADPIPIPEGETQVRTPSARIDRVVAGDRRLELVAVVSDDGGCRAGPTPIVFIEYRIEGGDWRKSPVFRFASGKPLRNGTTYKLEVRASWAGTICRYDNVNRVRPVLESGSPVSALGTPKTTPGAPKRLSVSGGRRSVTATWATPTSNGGAPIVDYVIQYSTNGRRWTTYRDGPGTGPSATITGLADGRTYSVRVAAVNSAGPGDWSKPQTTSTLGR